jgi:hypothetical protein
VQRVTIVGSGRGAHLRGAFIGLVAAATLSACGGAEQEQTSGESADGHETETPVSVEAVDQTVCRAEATAVPDPHAGDFPDEWVFPPETTVYHREDRAGVGVILTAVSEAPFDQILDFLNKDEVDAGFAITGGETEDDDAEADWSSDAWSGRWTIRKSGTCPGETVIQVFAAPAG